MKNILIDTSAFYALADRSDTYHSKALKFYEKNLQKRRFITTDYILVEVWILINHRLGRREAMEFWSGLRKGIIPILGIQKEDLELAFQVAKEFEDQDFSLVDATTFALMQRMSIKEAFTFDVHFSVFRHGPGRKDHFKCLPEDLT